MTEVVYDSPWLPLVACFFLSGLFVGSLYVWDTKHDRNHPSTIKQRFCSVLFVILISPFILQLFITSPKFRKYSTLELIGFRLSGIFYAGMLPLLLTMTLFLGPLVMQNLDRTNQFFNRRLWLHNLTNLIWLRNIVVGPLSEEFTFRACMIPLLLQSYNPLTAVFVCSLFFGLAHAHFIIDAYKRGEPCKIILIRALVQFFYTTLFGAYSAYVFYTTGHFIASVLIHAFCNSMGFPDFTGILLYDNPKRSMLIFLFVAGVVLWYFLFGPILNPKLYDNYVYFHQNVVP